MNDPITIEKLIDEDFKDNSPAKTVETIKDILADYGLEAEERWNDTNVPYCYSLSVRIKGTGFRVNGKGLSREFARASGYGELMERLQLGFLGKRAAQKDGAYSMSDTPLLKVPATDLLDKDGVWYEKMAARLKDWNGSIVNPKDIVMRYADVNGDVDVTPFVNLINGQKAFLPTEMRKNMYTSNGGAAGNSMEEAIVQALGEIVERYYRLQIISQKISTPEFPEEELKKFKVAHRIITYIRQQGYKISVKDCSLGKKFPVVCVCYVDRSSGRYHTHFGAYPILEIALERALTETFQDREIGSFAEYDELFLGTDKNALSSNVIRELVHGTSPRMPEFFIESSTCEYNKNVGFSGKNNKELLKECIDFFREQGHDVLVRDASCLGFPTCQVVIPGYSETYIHRISQETDEMRYLPFAVKAFRAPSKASLPDILGMFKHLNELQLFFTKDKKRSSFSACAKLMADLSWDQEQFLYLASTAYAYYTLGHLPNVQKNVENMIKLRRETDEEYLICLNRYLSMTIYNYNADTVKETLTFLHTNEVVERLYNCIDSGENPLEPFVLNCDMSCDNCVIRSCCYQKQALKLADIINKAIERLSFDEFYQSINELIRA